MKLTCPASSCRTQSDALTEVCERCGTPLGGYARLLSYPAHLFNQGLAAAQQGYLTQARDWFAAVVYWCPMDSEARNALAMTCLTLNDHTAARQHWEIVLARSPRDPIATRGIATIATAAQPSVIASSRPNKVRGKSKSGRGKRKQ